MSLPMVKVEDFAVIGMEEEMLMEVIRENLQGDNIFLDDLPRIKVPAAGNAVFNIDGDFKRELTGIICAFQKRRGYWEEKYDGSNAQPPICSSADGANGTGYFPSSKDEEGAIEIEGGKWVKQVCQDCSQCPLSKFGPNGENPACREMYQLFLLCEDGFLPIIINVPPTSLRSFRQYRTRLAARGQVYYSVVTRVSMKEDVSRNGQKINRLIFEKSGEIPKDQIDKLRAYTSAIKTLITNLEVTQEDFR